MIPRRPDTRDQKSPLAAWNHSATTDNRDRERLATPAAVLERIHGQGVNESRTSFSFPFPSSLSKGHQFDDPHLSISPSLQPPKSKKEKRPTTRGHTEFQSWQSQRLHLPGHRLPLRPPADNTQLLPLPDRERRGLWLVDSVAIVKFAVTVHDLSAIRVPDAVSVLISVFTLRLSMKVPSLRRGGESLSLSLSLIVRSHR